MTLLTRGEEMARDRAREMVAFLAGVEDAQGHPELCRRARLLAGDLLDTLAMVESERSARRAMQEARDRLLEQRFPGACT